MVRKLYVLMGDSKLVQIVNSENYWQSKAGKIRFSGARKSVLLKASSEERCAPQNFVHLVTFRGTRAHLSV